MDLQGYKVATFTLKNVSTSFESLYGCAMISGGSVTDIDFVYLQVRG